MPVVRTAVRRLMTQTYRALMLTKNQRGFTCTMQLQWIGSSQRDLVMRQIVARGHGGLWVQAANGLGKSATRRARPAPARQDDSMR
jgi:hypothetical protein